MVSQGSNETNVTQIYEQDGEKWSTQTTIQYCDVGCDQECRGKSK